MRIARGCFVCARRRAQAEQRQQHRQFDAVLLTRHSDADRPEQRLAFCAVALASSLSAAFDAARANASVSETFFRYRCQLGDQRSRTGIVQRFLSVVVDDTSSRSRSATAGATSASTST